MSSSNAAIGQILLAVSIFGLLHSAFSSYEQLSKMKAASDPVQLPAIDVMAEAVISLVVFTFGAAFWSPELKPNTWAAEMAHRTIDQMNSRPGFARIGHRGRFLPGKGKS
ncbi:hypothetical protein DACRYDRAFT_105940 [Dacryopinax primogenitus]|uniref:Membrane magnesium transporter n=1 Tax=Dacryopinax primogenitus (strain DJM 731) TaxID=1858805 RepID=M5G543_DACPD|nr:uncharacterized protein DACRYDRAFT_105940 [Dacryopinax primogenitus]EJU03784.1 hypothetical protein DACRYDRAFT_105940 [Dacryopinax primogenitus]